MKMRNMSKNALAVAVGAGLVAAPVLSAQAYEFAIGGHINRMAIQLDNGDQSDIFFADNDSSSSRLYARGSGDFGTGKAGFVWEHQFESNSAAKVDLPATGADNNSDSMRKAEVWFSNDWGKITLGQGSDAIDSVAEHDFGGTGLGGVYVGFPIDMMGDVTFVNSAGVSSGITVDSVITDFDGGRRDRVRYDSPSLGGALSFAVSLADGERLDASIKGLHEFGQNKFVWTVGVSEENDSGGTTLVAGVVEPDAPEPSTTLGSASLLIGGWDFSVSFSDRDLDVVGPREDPSQTSFKVGYTTAGGHSFGILAGTYDDIAADRDEADVSQIGWGYSPNKSVDLYASWTEAELDRPGTPLEDVTALLIGTRVKFK